MDLFDYQNFDIEDASDTNQSDYTKTEDIDITQGLQHLTLDERVRLAERGEKADLDVLVDDPDYRVRELVANHGYAVHLNQLVQDPHPIVRGEVAGVGKKKHLEMLKKDPDIELRAYVLEKLEK